MFNYLVLVVRYLSRNAPGQQTEEAEFEKSSENLGILNPDVKSRCLCNLTLPVLVETQNPSLNMMSVIG